MVKTVIFFWPSKGKASGRTMVLLCRANVTDSDLTLHKFKDHFSPISHIQNNHTYSFLIRSFFPSCWFLLWVSDQSFVFSFANTSSKICWKLKELFLFGINPLFCPFCFLFFTLICFKFTFPAASALPREHKSVTSVFSSPPCWNVLPAVSLEIVFPRLWNALHSW